MQSFQWSAQMLDHQPSSSSGQLKTSPSSTPHLQLSTPMTPQQQSHGLPAPFDFGTLGSLGPFQFQFAPPLPPINSFGAFPDFRHHPFMTNTIGTGSQDDKGQLELASAVPRFDFSSPSKRPQMTNPATSTYAQPTAHSPASSASHSSFSRGSRDSRSPSHSPAHSPETRSHPSLPLVPVPTYASNQYFPHHLAYPPPSSMPQAQMQSHSFPYSFAGPPVSSPVKVEGSGSSTALDMLAVAAGTSAHPPPTASLVSLTIEELHRTHLEQQDKISAGLKRQAEELEEAKKKKKRIGRGLDPGKTRTLIFPPALPPRVKVPKPEDEYTTRSVPSENLYAARYTKGKDSRTRVAFCEYCGETNLPTRMSGYGYHLLHTHNLSSHPPYLMPAPLSVRTIATTQQPVQFVLDREAACAKASPSLEGECPWKGEHGGGKCALTGYHKLNGWREAMNAHLGGKGLIRDTK